MKRIVLILTFLWSVAYAQNPTTLPKALIEAGGRYPIADSAALSMGIVLWGDSYTAGVGGSGDSIYPTRLQNISNFYVYGRGIAGETSTQIMTRFLSQPELWKYPTVFLVGYNNYSDSATVVSNTKRMVDSIRTRHNKYLVLSVPNGGGQPSGSAPYISIQKINTANAALYPGHYADWRSFIVSQYDPTSPPDVTNFSQDIPPISKRSDSIHYNNRGQNLMAGFVYSNFDKLLPREIVTTFNLKAMMNRLRINTANDSILFGPIQIRNGNIGFNSTSYSDRFTLGGGGSANTMAIYNTVDETTNYERLRIQALGTNGYNFTVQAGGTGSQRDMVFTTQNSGIRISGGVVTGAVSVSRNLTGGNAGNLGVTGTHSAASGFSNGIVVYNAIATTGTGGYNGILVSPSVTTMGSGTHYLLHLSMNGSANGGGPIRSKVTVDTSGNINTTGNLTAPNIAYTRYTPTAAGITNVASIGTVNSAHVTRIGEGIKVEGSFSFTPTSGSITTIVSLTLPGGWTAGIGAGDVDGQVVCNDLNTRTSGFVIPLSSTLVYLTFTCATVTQNDVHYSFIFDKTN
jgi:hypothetical protein